MKKLRELKTDNSKLLTVDGACARYQLGKGTIRKIAKEESAIVRIGRVIRINVDILDDYFDSLAAGKDR